tara:strand:- start:3941 stop:4651 length:711 start_codon:yes stop_codon:yes gene_type:complete
VEKKRLTNLLKILILLFIIDSCSYPEIIRDELIYENDFENNDLSEIDGGGFSKFNNTTVLGDFNNDGFTLHLNNVGDHEYVFVSFDLYIHGSWDGNFNGFDTNDKADKWIMEYRPDMDLFKDTSVDKFVTTFSNSPCFSNYCLRQSYPENYPYENNPKTGSFKTDLSRKCENNFFGGKTSLYKIERSFKSSGDAVVIRFYDELYQPNAVDKDGVVQSKCDESWSLDNLKVRVISYN